MKKVVSISLIMMLLVAVFAACSAPGSATQSPSSSPSVEAPAKSESPSADESTAKSSAKKIKVGIAECLLANDWVSAQIQDFKDYCKTDFTDIEITSVLDSNFDSSKDIDNVKALVSQGVDAIICRLTDFNMGKEIVDAAAGKPVIFVGRGSSDPAVLGNKNAYVCSDEYTGGKMVGEAIGKLMLQRGEKVANYVIFMGQLDAQNAVERTRGNKDGLASTGIKLNEVLVDAGNWARTEPLNKTQQLIGSGKKFNCLLANSDEMLLGAIEALKSNNIDLNSVAIGGFDGTAAGLESMASGEIDYDIFQDGKAQAKQCLQCIRDVMAGKDLKGVYNIPYQLITPENYKDFQNK